MYLLNTIFYLKVFTQKKFFPSIRDLTGSEQHPHAGCARQCTGCKSPDVGQFGFLAFGCIYVLIVSQSLTGCHFFAALMGEHATRFKSSKIVFQFPLNHISFSSSALLEKSVH